ncbi:hypothetical protein HZS_3686 [Henneguya salminicola]|nr:hypothetical protein HZS_3686 [Henneguya salminicola]
MTGVRAKKSKRAQRKKNSKILKRKIIKNDKNFKFKRKNKTQQLKQASAGILIDGEMSCNKAGNIMDIDETDQSVYNNENKKNGSFRILLDLVRKKIVHMPQGDIKMLEELLKIYGRNFEAMSRDSKNYKQLSIGQLRKLSEKVLKFKSQTVHTDIK